MADQDTTQETEEEFEDDGEPGDFDGEEADEDDTPDPFEGLHGIAEELQPTEPGAGGQTARIRAVSESLREQLTAHQEKLASEEPASLETLTDAMRALLDAKLFMLEELGETFMPYLAGLAVSARDNVADIRDWGEQEVEPFLEQLAGAPSEGAVEGSMLLPNDGKAINALLGELHYVLSNTAKGLDAGSDQYRAVQARLGHIEKIRGHVNEITLADDENVS